MEQVLMLLSEVNVNRGIAIIAVTSFGLLALCNVFKHMKPGFGQFNVRITGIVIIARFISILAVLSPTIENGSIGILGAIAGYLFGYGSKTDSRNDTQKNLEKIP
jgi:hypothetical protein